MIKGIISIGSLAQTTFAMIKPRDMAPSFKNVNAVVGQEFK